MGFKVAKDADLDHFSERLLDCGVHVDVIPAGEDPGVGRKIRFNTPTAHVFDLYAELELSENGPAVRNHEVCIAEQMGRGVSSESGSQYVWESVVAVV